VRNYILFSVRTNSESNAGEGASKHYSRSSVSVRQSDLQYLLQSRALCCPVAQVISWFENLRQKNCLVSVEKKKQFRIATRQNQHLRWCCECTAQLQYSSEFQRKSWYGEPISVLHLFLHKFSYKSIQEKAGGYRPTPITQIRMITNCFQSDNIPQIEDNYCFLVTLQTK